MLSIRLADLYSRSVVLENNKTKKKEQKENKVDLSVESILVFMKV